MTVQSYDRHLVLACSGTQRQSFGIYVKAVLPAIAYMAGHAADSDVPVSRRAILLYLRNLRPPFSFPPFFSLPFHSLAVRPMG